MPRFSRAPKIHFSSTRTRENRTPIFSLRCIIISMARARHISPLLSPIFLFPGRELYFGRLERDDLQVNAAIGAYDDLTGLGAFLQGKLGSTFGTRYSRHFYSPCGFQSLQTLGLRFFQRLNSPDFSQLI